MEIDLSHAAGELTDEALLALCETMPLFTEDPIGQQLEFYQSPAQTRLVLGGNRVGKTSCGARDTGWWLTGTHPYRDVPSSGAKGWVICETRDVAAEVLIPKVLSYLPEDFIQKVDFGSDYRPPSVSCHNSARLLFRTFGQGRRRMQSDAIDFFWGDEEMPHEIFKEAQMRLIDNDGSCCLTMTPLLGHTWVYTNLFLPWEERRIPRDQVDVFSWSMWDNPHLSRRAIEIALSQVEDESERSAREHGTFLNRTGLIYKQFQASVHLIEPFRIPTHWKAVLALDPGYRHPAAASLQVETPQGDRVVVGEVRMGERNAMTFALAVFRMVDRALPHLVKHRRLEQAFRQDRLQIRKIEPTFRSLVTVRDPAAASYGSELIQYGIPTRLANRDVMTGISRVGTMLGNAVARRAPGLYFVRGATPCHMDEIRAYRWKDPDGKEGAPLKKNDDVMDALRYGAMQPLSAKTFKLGVNGMSVTPGTYAAVEEAEEGLDLIDPGPSIGEWLAFSERSRAKMAHRRGRRYSDEDVMNHLEETRGRRFGVGTHSLRKAWGR